MKDHPAELKGMTTRVNPKNKWTVVKCFFYADAKKDPERVVCDNGECCHWVEDVKQNGKPCPACGQGTLIDYGQQFFDKLIAPLPHTQQQIEYYINHTAKAGKRVYPQFHEAYHTGHHAAPERGVLFRGWDFGGHHPAAVVCYDNTYLDRFEVLQCFLGYDIHFRVFCKEIVRWCEIAWPRCDLLEGIDPHGLRTNAQGGEIEEGSDTPASFMQNKYHMDVDWDNCQATDGRDQLAECITARPAQDGIYPFSINKTDTLVVYHRDPNTRIIAGTDVLIKGMAGQFRFPKRNDGTYGSQPVKSVHSHACDALMHAYLRARGTREQETETIETRMLLAAAGREAPGLDVMGGPSF